MKTPNQLMFCITLLSVLSIYFLSTLKVNAQKGKFPHSEIIKKEITIQNLTENNLLFLGNVSGSIDIEGYEGNTIEFELKKNINSSSKKETLRGIDEIKLKVLELNDKIFIYMDSPYTTFLAKEETYMFNNNCEGKSCYKYTFELNYKIRVPNSMNLILQTIDKGSIYARNMESKRIRVWNVSGSINLNKISGAVDAKTVKGDIDVSFKNNPISRCDFTTVNGNINAQFNKDVDAEISYQIRKGRFRNDFIQTKNKNKITDFIKGKIVVGAGDIPLNFNLVSGDINITTL